MKAAIVRAAHERLRSWKTDVMQTSRSRRVHVLLCAKHTNTQWSGGRGMHLVGETQAGTKNISKYIAFNKRLQK